MKQNPIQNSKLELSSVFRVVSILGVSCLLSLTSIPETVQAQSVTTDRPTYSVGEDIVVTFTGGPANAKDWIGIYPTGIAPGSVGSTLWFYVNGTETSTTGVADGTITFPGGLSAAGDYDVHLLADDGYGILASTTITVVGEGQPVAPTATVRTDHGKYFPGESISVTFENGPGNSRDWIGIYPEGVVPGSEGSTLWFYVNGSQSAAAGKVDGSVTFDAGLSLAGNWVAYLLENDGYSQLALADFQVVAPTDTLVRPDKRIYAPGETITVEFRNGFGNAKDWIGVYPAGITPGGVGSTLWAYVSGTQTSTTGEFDGTVVFADGLSQVGDYDVHFLINDGYDVLVTETISVAEPAVTAPKVVGTQPTNDATDVSPAVDFSATIKNGSSRVVTDSIALSIDGNAVAHELSQQDDLVTVSFSAPSLMPPNSLHSYELGFSDDANPPNMISAQGSFTVADYRNIILPEPIYFEDFNSTSEGELPTGWTEESFTDVLNFDLDLENLDSYSYSTWTVVEASRFTGSFVVYSNPDAPQGQKDDYQRVLSVNPRNVVNGTVLNEPLAEGGFLFGNAGYRNGIGQVLYVFTPDFDLTGQSNVHLSFHSLWEQNQDSMGAVEYSTDKGQTWLPIVYLLDEPDVVRDDQNTVDAVATFTQEHGDVARYFDPNTGEEKGGTYGAFIAAAIGQDLGPFISPRFDDDPSESKRVELFRLTEADNQPTVRIRFAHAGTDSWYFGIDDFGIYSISETPSEPVQLVITRAGDTLQIEWPASALGFVLESADSLPTASWQEVPGAANNTVSVSVSAESRFFRLRKQ